MNTTRLKGANLGWWSSDHVARPVRKALCGKKPLANMRSDAIRRMFARYNDAFLTLTPEPIVVSARRVPSVLS